MAKGLSITVLVENTANRAGLLAEHGLSFWIEANHRRLLFDTGQGMALAHNADRLGIDLRQADDVVLSHGHFDHTGGLLSALPDLRGATVYTHPEAFRDRFARRPPEGGVRSVRAPIESEEWLRSRVAKTVAVPIGPVALEEGLWLTGEIPRQNDFEDTGGAFYLDAACTIADTIPDDQALCAETSQGLVVLLGCAHSGVVNTLAYIRAMTGGSRIRAVLGGMHLLNASERRLEQTVRTLRELDVPVVGLAHCTGFAAMARLSQELAGRCFHCETGTRIAFD